MTQNKVKRGLTNQRFFSIYFYNFKSVEYKQTKILGHAIFLFNYILIIRRKVSFKNPWKITGSGSCVEFLTSINFSRTKSQLRLSQSGHYGLYQDKWSPLSNPRGSPDLLVWTSIQIHYYFFYYLERNIVCLKRPRFSHQQSVPYYRINCFKEEVQCDFEYVQGL